MTQSPIRQAPINLKWYDQHFLPLLKTIHNPLLNITLTGRSLNLKRIEFNIVGSKHFEREKL